MPLTTLPLRRQYNGYIDILPTTKNFALTQTAAPISDELWSMIRYYSEVKKNGVALARQNGTTNRRDQENAWKSFRAYIRQAQSYYEIARATPARSAALLYYYSFLNLAKAGLSIRQNRTLGARPGHGLYFNSGLMKPLDKLTVKFSSGVATLFYTDYFGIAPARLPLRLATLLGYCMDIGDQYSLCGYGATKQHQFQFKQLNNSTNQTSWSICGVRDFRRVSPYKKSFREFNKEFEEIDLPQAEAKELFDLNAWGKGFYSFFQSKVARPWPMPDVPYQPQDSARDCEATVKNLLNLNYFGVDPPAFISEPYAVRNQMPMNELTAIYIVMFCMSNLVRYNPAFLERVLESHDSWMIENFIQYTPETFLRSVVGWLTGREPILMRR